MADSLKKVEVSAFDAMRIKALETYSQIEIQLSLLLSALLEVGMPKAMTILYRIANTRSRYAIISDLLSQSEHKSCRPFWNGLETSLGKVDTRRNHIVHWVGVVNMGVIGGALNQTGGVDKTLVPGHRDRGSFEGKLTISDMRRFIDDVNALIMPMLAFASYLSGQYEPETRVALLQIFQQPPNDQTQEALQSALFSKAPEPPPQQSQV